MNLEINEIFAFLYINFFNWTIKVSENGLQFMKYIIIERGIIQ